MNHGIIIALHGARGAGKDTIADYLVSRMGFIKVAFADPLRQECCAAWNVTMDLFTTPGLKDKQARQLTVGYCLDHHFRAWVANNIPGIYHYDELTPRGALNLYSDFKKSINDKFYYTLKTQELLKGLTGKNVVISDCRLPQEADLLDQLEMTHFDKSMIFKVNRPYHGEPVLNEHSTDIAFEEGWIDATILNDKSKFELCQSAMVTFCEKYPTLRNQYRVVLINELYLLNNIDTVS